MSTTPASESGPRARPPSRQPTGSARRAHGRVADLHAALALSHDDHAKALRLRHTGASDLTDDEKAALWLLASSYPRPRAQRREAIAHLERLSAATPPRAIKPRRRLRAIG